MQLVGEMELEEREVQLPDDTTRTQLSTVHIKKCRYLEQSGCVGMCVNMCKVRFCCKRFCHLVEGVLIVSVGSSLPQLCKAS